MGTKALLLGGSVAGPLFIMVGLGQALLRDGFDLRHNTLSLLSNGAFGWVQVLNFSLSGALYFGGAIGAGRALRQPGSGGIWGPRLLACFGLCMIGAGVFRPDPAFGFPPEPQPGRRPPPAGTAASTTPSPASPSWPCSAPSSPWPAAMPDTDTAAGPPSPGRSPPP
jgi:Protein of unknown function (DUF998)